MSGSSLSIWAIILIVGVLTVFSMGCYNPFITKVDKERAKKLSKKENVPKDKCCIEMKFHFDGIAYVLATLTFSAAALISFLIEDFTYFKNTFFVSGFWGYVLAALSILAAMMVVDLVLLVIPMVAESKTVSSIANQYSRRYGVEVITIGYNRKKYPE